MGIFWALWSSYPSHLLISVKEYQAHIFILVLESRVYILASLNYNPEHFSSPSLQAWEYFWSSPPWAQQQSATDCKDSWGHWFELRPSVFYLKHFFSQNLLALGSNRNHHIHPVLWTPQKFLAVHPPWLFLHLGCSYVSLTKVVWKSPQWFPNMELKWPDELTFAGSLLGGAGELQLTQSWVGFDFLPHISSVF